MNDNNAVCQKCKVLKTMQVKRDGNLYKWCSECISKLENRRLLPNVKDTKITYDELTKKYDDSEKKIKEMKQYINDMEKKYDELHKKDLFEVEQFSIMRDKAHHLERKVNFRDNEIKTLKNRLNDFITSSKSETNVIELIDDNCYRCQNDGDRCSCTLSQKYYWIEIRINIMLKN